MGCALRPINLAAAMLLAVSAASPVWAHGIRPHGDEGIGTERNDTGKTSKPQALWLLPGLVAPAEAAVTTGIDAATGLRTFRADGLPDHETGRFPNRGNPNAISRQNYTFRVSLKPETAAQITPLRNNRIFGVAINGVVFDPGTAEFWKDDPRTGWNIEALSGRIDLGLDRNNAHVQPDGSYHYHGLPNGIIEKAKPGAPILIGWAADGFPIYGPFGYSNPRDASSPLARLRPSYRLKPGTRGNNAPPGTYDGTYTQDFEFVAGSGDLDVCNGRVAVTPEFSSGIYQYVLTEAFPHIPRCFSGTPDASFLKQGPGPGGSPNGGPGGRPPGMRPPPDGGIGGPPPRMR